MMTQFAHVEVVCGKKFVYKKNIDKIFLLNTLVVVSCVVSVMYGWGWLLELLVVLRRDDDWSPCAVLDKANQNSALVIIRKQQIFDKNILSILGPNAIIIPQKWF